MRLRLPRRQEVVRAAGGLVVRPGPEVLLVHRPKYDDWTFPKGKAKPGETGEACALREVEEETGLRCLLGAELATTRYTDSRGRPKAVRYWQMTVQEGAFVANREVDEIAWLDPKLASERLSYDRDRSLLARLP
ncbi:MAG: NUDIX hydrolase [Gaiellaceae bacterium MAG52_C11]|nr:NUDIX hydrolase [Candidatus Gaiellasilicea maunaloa]